LENPRYGGGRHLAAILKNQKIAIISAAVKPILTKFGMMMQFTPLERSDR